MRSQPRRQPSVPRETSFSPEEGLEWPRVFPSVSRETTIPENELVRSRKTDN